MKKVVVGLSGGVDSSIAAYLLKKQGHEVTGLYMINWHDKTGTIEGACPWKDDLIFAQLVARKLDIDFHSIDLSREYKSRVVDYMFSEYRKGRTPNPDVLCNREIKFDVFARTAEKFGAEMIATGHYCRKRTTGKINRLLAGVDRNKEQSYFLCQLSQDQLENVLFPVGEMTKEQVRKLAADLDLPTARRKDSQGICFIGRIDLPEFLRQRMEPVKGQVIEIPRRFAGYLEYCADSNDPEKLSKPFFYHPGDGVVIGTHNGAHFYTIGQRKGLNIGGKENPLFVIHTDTQKNIVYTGQGKDHPGLFRKGLFIRNEDIHWLRKDLEPAPGDRFACQARIRYRQPLQNASLVKKKNGSYIVFDRFQRGITPGQFAAWYRDDELLGSGVIAQ